MTTREEAAPLVVAAYRAYCDARLSGEPLSDAEFVALYSRVEASWMAAAVDVVLRRAAEIARGRFPGYPGQRMLNQYQHAANEVAAAILAECSEGNEP